LANATPQANEGFFDSFFGGQQINGAGFFGKIRKTPEMNMSCFILGTL